MSPAAAAPEPALYLGLISGTSADGIDAALVRFTDEGAAPACKLIVAHTFPWQTDLRAALISLGQGGDAASLDDLGKLDAQTGHAFADAALQLLANTQLPRSAVRAIGSHGQTIRHRPHAVPPFTWQLGDGNVIAERTGIDTVADFRRRDVAAGGHGAPLMPAFHAALLHSAEEDRAVLNLGGIGNFTLLPRQGDVRGFDTGPANALLDAWCERHTGKAFDAAGAFAASGEADTALLARLLDDAWFALPPPKSTGREQFHLAWLEGCLQDGSLAAEDVQATLLELTVVTVTESLMATQPGTRRVLVCGGGVHNRTLMARLDDCLPGITVESTAMHGLDPDYVEAMGFAWLAREALVGRPGNLASVTGAKGPRVLGVVYPG